MPFVPGSSRRVYTNPKTQAQLRAALGKINDLARVDNDNISQHEIHLQQFLAAANREAVIDEAGSAGDVIYVVSEGHIALADASDDTKWDAKGILLANFPAGGLASYCAAGVVTIPDFGLTPNTTYFLDAATPGGLVTAPVDATGNAAIIVGVSLSQDEFLVDIRQKVIL